MEEVHLNTSRLQILKSRSMATHLPLIKNEFRKIWGKVEIVGNVPLSLTISLKMKFQNFTLLIKREFK
jgi:hypothetical protein